MRSVIPASAVEENGIEIIDVSDDEFPLLTCHDFSDHKGGRWESHTIAGPGEKDKTVAFCLECWRKLKDAGVRLQDGRPLTVIETWK